MNRVRCFLAAELPKVVLDDLALLRKRLELSGIEARWVSRETLHLTIKFFSEIEPDCFQKLIRTAEAPLAVPEINLGIQGLGVFPDPARPRILWTGLKGDVATLAKAAAEIETRFEALGFPRETRPFKPHLTIARAKARKTKRGIIKGFDCSLEKEAEYQGPMFTINEFVLFESILRPQGPQHTKRATMRLVQ